MKKIFAVYMLMLMIFFAGCGGENISDTTEGSKTFASKGKIVIGIDDEFAPISFHDDKHNLIGFDVDLAK